MKRLCTLDLGSGSMNLFKLVDDGAWTGDCHRKRFERL